MVSESEDGRRLLLGEVRWRTRTPSPATVARDAMRVAKRTPPSLPKRYRDHQVVRALFVPELPTRTRVHEGVALVPARDILVP